MESLTFKDGSISVVTAGPRGEAVDRICLKDTGEAHGIGDPVEYKDSHGPVTPENTDIELIFTNPDSIQVVVDALMKIRLIMIGTVKGKED